MDNTTRNQQRLARYNAKRIQYLICQQYLMWLSQAGSPEEFQQRVAIAHKQTGFKQA